jgi:hypothetical protein
MWTEISAIERHAVFRHHVSNGRSDVAERLMRIEAHPADARTARIGEKSRSGQRRRKFPDGLQARREPRRDAIDQSFVLLPQKCQREMLRLRADPGSGRETRFHLRDTFVQVAQHRLRKSRGDEETHYGNPVTVISDPPVLPGTPV